MSSRQWQLLPNKTWKTSFRLIDYKEAWTKEGWKGAGVRAEGRAREKGGLPHMTKAATIGRLESVSFYGWYTCTSYPLSLWKNESNVNMKKKLPNVSAAFPGCIPHAHPSFAWILHAPCSAGPSTAHLFSAHPLDQQTSVNSLWPAGSDSIHCLNSEAPSRRGFCMCHGESQRKGKRP